MGVLTQFWGRLTGSEPTITNSADLLKSFGEGDHAGQSVTTKSAIQTSAVLCCARVIAEGLAQVPCKVYRDDDTGSPVEAKEHPLFFLLNRKPNDWQTSFEFREQIGFHLALTNNAFIFKNRVNGKIEELYAFLPNTVTVEQADDLTLTYKVQDTKGRLRTLPADDVWHIRGPSWDGIQGLDAINLAAKTIGLSMATEEFGSKFFENGGRPGGIITTKPGTTPLSAEQRNEIKTLWAAQHQGSKNAHKTVMLPFDLDFTSVSTNANEAQWIESREFIIKEICRFFRVQPIMVMASDATSYASVEQLFLNHLMHTLMPWYERFEQSAEVSLFTKAELLDGYSVKLNSNALLRANTADRASYYQTMRSIGAMTANEVRAKEDMPRHADAEADKLAPAANIFGGANKTPNAPQAGTSQEPNNNEVSK